MKKGLIVFKGKYGASRQYAQWLGHQLDLPYWDASQMSAELLSSCDFIVLGGAVYYGKLLLRSFIMKHIEILKTKKLFIFIVCATPDSDERTQKQIVKQNIPKLIANRDDIYFLPGRLVIEKLKLGDRLMLRLAAAFEKDPVKKQVMLNGIDSVNQDNLIDIVIAVTMYSRKKKDSPDDLTRRSPTPDSPRQ